MPKPGELYSFVLDAETYLHPSIISFWERNPWDLKTGDLGLITEARDNNFTILILRLQKTITVFLHSNLCGRWKFVS